MKKVREIVKIQGFGVDSFSLEEAADYLNNNSGQVVTINPEMIMKASKDKSFADIISAADLVVPDGIGVEIGLKILGHKVRRIPGIELGKTLIKNFTSSGKRIAFVGGKPNVAETAIANLKKEFPEMNSVYCHDGYFKDDEVIYSEVVSANPDLILVALGSPKQEFFISKLKEKLPNAVMIGLGGSFDVWAGIVDRAPVIFQKIGLEWLYRTIKEPQRFKRIFPALPVFVLKVLKERVFK
jgi:N-acetylglucosaminyldiphosphoundecaprenol N-acetyl-beta-D-mannosaminyltransferase